MIQKIKNNIHQITRSDRCIKHGIAVCFLCCIMFVSSSCIPTYRADELENSIKRLCKDEYGIDEVEVKIAGKTLGAFLPLEKLFSANLDSFASKDSVKNLEDLLRFDPAAMDKIEDVLFTTSRVILSTDRAIDFYVLKAIESQTTGIELVMTGYVQDMKRVRFWDIAVSEYRKRILHDLSVNKAVVWKRTVTDFFNDIGRLSLNDLIGDYFLPSITLKDISPFFYSQLLDAEYKESLVYDIQTVKTKPISEDEVLVYVKARETYVPGEGYEQHPFVFQTDDTHEYLIILQATQTAYAIKQVIPFYYIDSDHLVHTLDFPAELKIYDNIDAWTEVYELEEVFMGDFLARQLTKRAQALVASDPALSQVFAAQGLSCSYSNETNENDEEAIPFFAFRYEKKASLFALQKNDYSAEDVDALYFALMKEFNAVINGYHFSDFSYVELPAIGEKSSVKIAAHIAEKFRLAKQMTIKELLQDSF